MDLSQIDYHIANLEESLEFLKQIKKMQNELKALGNVESMKEQLNFLMNQMASFQQQGQEIQGMLEGHQENTPLIEITDEPADPSCELTNVTEVYNDMEELVKFRKLLMSEKWPTAVPQHQIIDLNDDGKKLIRAGNILNNLVRQRMDDATFLDFGCGEGHIAYKAAQEKNPKMSIAYDIQPQGWERFDQMPNFVATDRFGEVSSYSPYDFIILYDVLDHAVNKDPEEILLDIRKLCKEDTKIFIRCHPWTSKHGTHIYRKLNKAYPHLVFTDEELSKLGQKSEWPTLKIIHPISTYKEWFNKTGFEIVKEDIIKEPVDEFFEHITKISDKIKAHWKDKSPIEAYSTGKEFPKDIMQVQFVDYVLRKL